MKAISALGLSTSTICAFPVRPDEVDRLAALGQLDILDTPASPSLDAVVKLASAALGLPIGLISLVDQDRQWFKACEGLSVSETPREMAFCNYPVYSGEPFVVTDTFADDRFRNNPLVTGAPFIRFYAGYPLSLDDGLPLGTLCVIGTEPRSFSAADLAILAEHANIAMALLRQHRDALTVHALLKAYEDQRRTIDEQMRAIRRQNTVFEHASRMARIGAWEVDIATDELIWTDGMYDIHGLPRGSVIRRDEISQYYSPEFRDDIKKLIETSQREMTGYEFEGEMTLPNGDRRWIKLASELEAVDGIPVRRYGMMQDVTEQRELADRTQALATRDPLTGLSNRHILQVELARLVKPAARDSVRSLLLIDLDGFKHVNDSYGHLAGDYILKTISRRLKTACPYARVVTRLGGDEFAILLDGNPAETAARAVVAACRRAIKWRGKSFQLSSSVGIRAWPSQKAVTAQDVMSEADLALYAAKDAGKNGFKLFIEPMKSAAHARSEIVMTLARAVEDNALELFYQPKVNLRTRQHLGFEALLRLRLPNGGYRAPGDFEAALPDPEISRRLGDFVVTTALAQAKSWHDRGLAFGHIAINLSGSQFVGGNFARDLTSKIKAYGLPAGTIEIEITESVFLGKNTEVIRSTLNACRAAGVRIALDDFGTGFASLSHLCQFPIDTIKIDRAFVNRFLQYPEDNAIVQSILFLARTLHMDVVAEGIELESERQMLGAYGCQKGQGYLFSRPLQVSDAEHWVLASNSQGAIQLTG